MLIDFGTPSSVSQARRLLLKEKAVLTVSNVFSAGEHSSPLTVFNLHNCFACGTLRMSSPTNELKAFCYTVSSILVLAPTRQSSGFFQKEPITANELSVAYLEKANILRFVVVSEANENPGFLSEGRG